MSHLILSRAVGEKFVIKCHGVDIWISIIEIRRRHQAEVRVSINAPTDVIILREEVARRDEEGSTP